MFSTICWAILTFGLLLGAGWLTWRALHARKRWVKIAGGMAGAAATLLLAAITFFAGRGVAAIYFPPAATAPAPMLTVAGTPEQIARGEYLANISCASCHSALGADGRPDRTQTLSGGWNIGAVEGLDFMGDIIVENLTPGGKLAGYTDGEIFRAIRHGVSKEGHRLAFMPLLPYGQLSDADTEAIIAYLRTLPAIDTPRATGDRINFLGAMLLGSGLLPDPAVQAEMVSAPAPGTTAEYGRYVATFGECRGCHGADMTGAAATAVTKAYPNPRPFVGALSLAQFIQMMRSGIKPDGVAFPEGMPWQNASKMNDDDLAALYAYLTAAP